MIFYLFLGCAVKSTVELGKAKKVYVLAEEAGKMELYPYEMTYAHSLLNKAWEEYSTANYKTANVLAQEAQEWINKTRVGDTERSIGGTIDTSEMSVEEKIKSGAIDSEAKQ